MKILQTLHIDKNEIPNSTTSIGKTNKNKMMPTNIATATYTALQQTKTNSTYSSRMMMSPIWIQSTQSYFVQRDCRLDTLPKKVWPHASDYDDVVAKHCSFEWWFFWRTGCAVNSSYVKLVFLTLPPCETISRAESPSVLRLNRSNLYYRFQ